MCSNTEASQTVTNTNVLTVVTSEEMSPLLLCVLFTARLRVWCFPLPPPWDHTGLFWESLPWGRFERKLAEVILSFMANAQNNSKGLHREVGPSRWKETSRLGHCLFEASPSQIRTSPCCVLSLVKVSQVFTGTLQFSCNSSLLLSYLFICSQIFLCQKLT